MFPGLHPMAMMATSGMGYTSRSGAGYQGGGIYGSGPAPYPPMYPAGPPPPTGGPQTGDATVSSGLFWFLNCSEILNTMMSPLSVICRGWQSFKFFSSNWILIDIQSLYGLPNYFGSYLFLHYNICVQF